MNARKHILMNSVAIPVMAAAITILAGASPLLAQTSKTGVNALKLAQANKGGGGATHLDKAKGDQKYPDSASRIGGRPQQQNVEITPPTDPVALQAFNVLDKHCARCHQGGRLVNRTKPDKDFGNVLKLNEIARNPSLVLPGNPDASPLFTTIVNKEMPYDVYKQNSGGAEPTAQEVGALRTWIESLESPTKTASSVCGSRTPLGLTAVTDTIAADVEKEQANRRAGLRYISLTHLHNSCADENEMAAYRQAAVKLLNGLSRKSEAVTLQTVGEDQGIIKFHLDDLGWTASDWNRILASYPYAVAMKGDKASTLQQQTGTPLPWVRGDWLAYTASRAPLYHDLANQPRGSESLKARLEAGGEALDQLNTKLASAGLEANQQLDGVEVVTALAKRYERNVDLRVAAAEFDVSQKQLREALDGAGIRAYWMKRRLEQGTVPRATFERRFADLVQTVSNSQLVDTENLTTTKPEQVATVSETKPADGSSFELTLFSDKSVYKQNDLAVFTVQSKKDCNLTLINVDGKGNGTVIFPNKFQQDNFLAADKVLKFPADDASFQFRLRDKGTESVIAVCNAGGKTADGIKHDFRTRSFTPLGNYRKFLFRQIAVESSGGQAPAQQPTAQVVSNQSTAPATGNGNSAQGGTQQTPSGQTANPATPATQPSAQQPQAQPQTQTTQPQGQPQTTPPAATAGETGGSGNIVRTAIKFEVQ